MFGAHLLCWFPADWTQRVIRVCFQISPLYPEEMGNEPAQLWGPSVLLHILLTLNENRSWFKKSAGIKEFSTFTIREITFISKYRHFSFKLLVEKIFAILWEPFLVAVMYPNSFWELRAAELRASLMCQNQLDDQNIGSIWSFTKARNGGKEIWILKMIRKTHVLSLNQGSSEPVTSYLMKKI